MSVDKLINLLALATLIEMMVTIGLGVPLSDILKTSNNAGLMLRAVVANYILFPAVAVGLLFLFHADPMVAAGFFLIAVCPGAPYGPPFTAMAKGNVAVAVGLMVVLAGSSAILTPMLVGSLLPVLVRNATLNLNVPKMIGILLCAQLLPLCVGLWIRKNHTVFAEFITKPAKLLSVTLNLLTVALIFWAQFQMLKDIRLKGCLGMLCLLFAGLAVGRLMGGSDPADAKGMVLTTSARNVGVSLVVATGSFPGTAAITSTTAYAIVQTIAVGLIALAWGRLTPTIHLIRQKAA